MARRRLGEQAASWYLDQQEGLSEPAQREFVRWLKQSPEHVREYLAMAQLHGDLRAVAALDDVSAEQLRVLADSDPAVVPLPGVSAQALSAASASGHQRTAPRRHVARWSLAVAATLALAATTLIDLARSAAPATVFSATAEQGRDLHLPDGTLVQLGKGSAIAVRFDARQRRIDLLHGMALFDVGKDPTRPLQVRMGNNVLRDIGTVFEAQQAADGGAVTVLSGRIHVLSSPHPWLHEMARTLDHPLPGGDLVADLGAGQQAHIDGAGRLTALEPDADIAQATAWLPATIRFRNRPVAEVARRFNAYTRTPLVIEDPAIGKTRISGLFHAHDVAAFTAYLASLPGVRVAHEAQRIRVLASAHRTAAKPRSL